MSNVQRWTGPVTAFDGGGFVCYGDYLTLEKQLAAAQKDAEKFASDTGALLAERDRQLAEAQARIDELTTMCEDLVCEAKDFAYMLEQKTVQLVEAQAALALKDEAFQKIIDIRIIPATTYGIARTALAIKPDNQALREWGARLLEELDDDDQKGTLY